MPSTCHFRVEEQPAARHAYIRRSPGRPAAWGVDGRVDYQLNRGSIDSEAAQSARLNRLDERLADARSRESSLRGQLGSLRNEIKDLKTVASKATTSQNESEDEKEATSTTTPARSRQFGFIKKVYRAGGKPVLTMDYAEMLTGDAANRAAVEDGYIEAGETVPNDYYIRNRNSTLRILEIASGVTIIMATWRGPAVRTFAEESMEYSEIRLSDFENVYSSEDAESKRVQAVPYWVELLRGQVVKITEQYIP